MTTETEQALAIIDEVRAELKEQWSEILEADGYDGRAPLNRRSRSL